ncbi:tetratricopeptide repeat-containing diguanylate cyclase [Shewanella acanthi]|uniref:tetratricopeptide repeat-containing diguanylate cyclase n=1 Tax=Shewanella acanthi TaxID=2864212 RepID=UPI001C656CB0|nr:GGDEF domain-containing protein [Shewanella acanthi]QYJ79465.1 GGDEF domain-containing protein [Shewanella acanthi]
MLQRLYILILSSLLLSLTLNLAFAEDKSQADKIIAQFENGDPMVHGEIAQKLALLRQLVSKDDALRMEKLKALECWNQAADSDAAIKKAISNSAQVLDNPPPSASTHYLIDMTLCNAWFLQMDGDINAAMAAYTQSIKRAYDTEDIKLIADSRSLRGALYSYIGDFTSALNDLVTAQDLYESLNLTSWANINLADIANSFRRYGDPQSAIRYYKKLKDLYEKNGNELQLIYVTTDMGLALDELGEHQQAIDNFLISYKYQKDHKLTMEAAVSATNIAYSLLKLNRLNEAERYLVEADKVISDQDPAAYSFMKLFMGEVKFKKAQFAEALIELEEAEKAFVAEQNERGQAQLLQLKSEVLSSLNDMPAAYAALEQYVTLTKKIDNNSLTSQTNELKVKFDTSRIELENKRLLENQSHKEQEMALLERNKSLQYIILLLTGFSLAIVSIFAYKLVHRNRELQTVALTDHLTKLPNRRHIYSKAEAFFLQAIKQRSPFSVIIFDADHFKKINDQFGHEIGDHALIAIANACLALYGDKQIVGRIGGEEFLVLLPDTEEQMANKHAIELQQKISQIAAETLPEDLILTISAGVATLINSGSSRDENIDELVKRADCALYEAKNAGRNCVKLAKSHAT